MYIRPQEYGNKEDVRWFTLTDTRGLGIKVTGVKPLSMSAWPWSMDDLDATSHSHELPERDFVTLNIDHMQMGVGGDNSWGHKVRPQYSIPSGKNYDYSFVLMPVVRQD